VAFTAVCAWAGSGWLLPPNDALPALERQGLSFTAVAVIGTVLGGLRGRGSGWNQRGRVGVASVLFFAIPAVMISRAREYAPETSVAVMFAMAPVVVVLVWGAVTQVDSGMRRLIPALMGLAGVLLVLPFELPVSSGGWAALVEIVVAMVLVSGAGVWLYGLLRRLGTAEALVLVGISNAAFLHAWCSVTGSFDSRWREIAGGWWLSLATAMVAGLTVWLLRRMEPVRLSARFLVIPLITILEGAVLLRPELTARTVVGVVLLAGGAWYLLTAKQRVDEEVLTLR
jgi:drug/metabolite transporter (DMT)-like permease